jgi:hypothetical protein
LDISLGKKDENYATHQRFYLATQLRLKSILSEQRLRVRFEVFKAVSMKNAVFWHITPCGSCKKRRFGGT